MTVNDFYRALEAQIPPVFSEEEDCDGAQIMPDPSREVRRVLVSLDPYAEAVATAVRGGYDVLLTHHPLFFFVREPGSPPDDWGKILEENKIAQFSFHMRLDNAEGGVNDVLASLIGLSSVVRFGIPEAPELGRVGELPREMSDAQFADHVKTVLGAPAVRFTPRRDGSSIRRVAVVGGAASDFLDAAANVGADALVGGEFKHHTYEYAAWRNLTLAEAGHYCTEVPVCAHLAQIAASVCPEAQIDTICQNPTLTV